MAILQSKWCIFADKGCHVWCSTGLMPWSPAILNLYKLSTGDSCTLELRAKHGSNDSTEIKYFCDLIEKFYEIALQLDKDKILLN